MLFGVYIPAESSDSLSNQITGSKDTKYYRPKVVPFPAALGANWQRLDSDKRRIPSSQRVVHPVLVHPRNLSTSLVHLPAMHELQTTDSSWGLESQVPVQTMCQRHCRLSPRRSLDWAVVTNGRLDNPFVPLKTISSLALLAALGAAVVNAVPISSSPRCGTRSTTHWHQGDYNKRVTVLLAAKTLQQRCCRVLAGTKERLHWNPRAVADLYFPFVKTSGNLLPGLLTAVVKYV